jgi:hypothetical protein
MTSLSARVRLLGQGRKCSSRYCRVEFVRRDPQGTAPLIDSGFTAHHDIDKYWDGRSLKIFRGVVTMTFAT